MKNISFRVGMIFVYALSAISGLTVLFILPFAIKDSTVNYQGSDRIFVAAAIFGLVVVPAILAFSAGRLWEWKKLIGRPIGFDGLIQPGTLLPQSKSFFRFIGKHELDGKWVIAFFEQVTKDETFLDPRPSVLSRANLFCVLTEGRAVPEKPCFVRLEYDQKRRINATILRTEDGRLGLN